MDPLIDNLQWNSDCCFCFYFWTSSALFMKYRTRVQKQYTTKKNKTNFFPPKKLCLVIILTIWNYSKPVHRALWLGRACCSFYGNLYKQLNSLFVFDLRVIFWKLCINSSQIYIVMRSEYVILKPVHKLFINFHCNEKRVCHILKPVHKFFTL